MFPWEHLGFGYLLYSLAAHAVGRAPRTDAVVAVAVATLLPDVVDKTLSWVLGVFPQGYSVAHSAFTVALLVPLAVAAAHRARRTEAGVAFCIGYVSHLVGDIVYPALYGGGLNFAAVLWPLVSFGPYDRDYTALERVVAYVGGYVDRLLALEPGPFLYFQAAFVGVVLVVWLYDGAPVLADLWTYLRRRTNRPRT